MGEDVSFAVHEDTTGGYLAQPTSGPGPGIMVLQEWWGVVPQIRSVCDRFAEVGFTALAPDLYHGESTTSPDEAGRLMMALEIDRTALDLAAAAEFLRGHASGSKVGVVGFCMGGQLALYAACQMDSVGACVDFYGIHPKVEPDLASLRAPVLGFFGENDEFVSGDAARTLESRIREAGGSAEFYVYPDAGHAFFNDARPEAYNEDRALEAWDRTVSFFRRHLD